ncbi:MAG: glycogen/starch synthase [Robiginitalea sp.]
MRHQFLFVAAENDALPECKAGGMGDVVRDVPRELARRGDAVQVVVPSYGRLHQAGRFVSSLEFSLRGLPYTAELYEVPPRKKVAGITHFVIHHPEITAGEIAHMYHHDPEEPFYTDAVKFTIFCAAVAAGVQQGVFGKPEFIHLHDWHSSLLLFLREFHPACTALKPIRFVYSIHNLAIQGIRPFSGNYSSLEHWFPGLPYDRSALQDPRFTDCMNLMALGIRLADAVHTVSPTYRKDIMKPSAPPEFIGGEGLEEDLVQADREGRLFGILNGCNYRNIRKAKPGTLFPNAIKAIFQWLQMEDKKYKADFLAHTGEKILPLLDKPPGMICSSVARLTEQKFYFFRRSPESLFHILRRLEQLEGVYMLLGTGAPEYEEFFRKVSYENANFIFINAQSEDLIDSMYLETDLYLMPSLFEPCGISQMLAMRNSNPCLAHATGGLNDTISHLKTGFLFGGNTYAEKIEQLQVVFDQALALFQDDPEAWEKICKRAGKQRFTWRKSVDAYYRDLYQIS